MKKFLTVLLVIAVMFTFSFGSAFAADDTAVSYDDAQLIKSASAQAQSSVAGTLEKAYKAIVAAGELPYITEDAWVAAVADIQAAMVEDIQEDAEKYIKGEKALPGAGWNAYPSDLAYTANQLFPTAISYIALRDALKVDGNDYAFIAGTEQFKMDYKDAISLYDKVDLESLYSKTTPDAKNSYYKQASDAIEASKEALEEYFFEKGKVDETKCGTLAALETASNDVKAWVENGISNEYIGKVTGVASVKWTGTDVVKYYYLKDTKILMKDQEAAGEAVSAAEKAALKAEIAKSNAKYLQTPNADKDAAAQAVEMMNFLVDEDVIKTAGAQTEVTGWINAPYFEANYKAIQGLKAYAEKYKAEKDAAGNLVRNAADVDDIVVEAMKAAYGNVYTKYETAAAEQAIAALNVSGDTAKLAFDKEAKKADLADILDELEDDYYDLEFKDVKAAYEAAYAKIDAAEKKGDFTAIVADLNKAVNKIAKKDEVNALFTSGAMKKELETQVAALGNYLGYKNTFATSSIDNAYIKYPASLTNDVRNYYIENNARTLAEMKALTGVVEAVAATYPTVGELEAARTAAKDAVKALPAVSKVTSADKDLFVAADAAITAYEDLCDAAGITADKTGMDMTSKVDALRKAMESDILLAYAKADKTDKAALKAIAADVKAANDLELFAKDIDDPTVTALKKIRENEKAAVIAAINAIPVNVTEADKATVEKARALYDAFVEEYTDYDLGEADNDAGYVAKEFAKEYHELALAEAALGLNAEDPALSVEALKITARSTAKKGSITVKWTVKGDTAAVEGWEIWKSTKKNSGYKKAFTQKAAKKTYKNTKGLKKGTRYYYKVRAIAYTADGTKVKSDWSNKAYRIAK